MKTLSIHQFPKTLKHFNIDTAKLGCVMLDIEDASLVEYAALDEMELGHIFYKSPDKAKFWIDGVVMDKAHITLLYGFLEQAENYKEYIEEVLAGWSLDFVEIESISYFDSPYPDEPYYCVVANIKVTPELLEGHERLQFLPHVKTFPGYKAHMTIAYLKKDKEHLDNYIDGCQYLIGKKLKINNKLNLGGNK